MRRTFIAIVLGLAVVASVGVATAGPKSADVQCAPTSFDVATPNVYTVKATACQPSGTPRAAVILVHGSTYDRSYWNPEGLDSRRYSTLKTLAGLGLLVVAVDRLGSGASDRPPDEEMTADVSAKALADVARQLRSNQNWRTTSSKVFMVGHSSGSTLTIRTATSYPGILDGLVITGLHHTPGIGADIFLAMLHPASDDPKFQGDTSIPSGYVTTKPGLRVLWYDIYGPSADPDVLAYDEQNLKDAMPQVDSGGFVDEVFDSPRSPQVTVPVLVVVGEHDYSHCNPGIGGRPDCTVNAEAERQFWPKASDYSHLLVPNAGHVLTLHENARETTRKIGRWIDNYI